MNRLSAAFLFSVVILAGSLSAERGRAGGLLPGLFGGKTPAKPLPAGQISAYGPRLDGPATPPIASPALVESSVELAAVDARMIPVPAEAPQASSVQPMPSVHQVNSRELLVDFEVKSQGPSGVGNVELWYTRNGQTWQKYPGNRQVQSPFVVKVGEDGLYGFSVVAG